MTIDNVIAPPLGTLPIVWAQILNTSFSAMDSHAHSGSDGVLLDSSIINFNGDFSCPIIQNWQFVGLGSSTVATPCTVLSDGLDLIAYDGIAREIFITKDGVLNTATVAGGGFIGDYVSSGAMATYNSGTETYNFLLASASIATLACASVNTANFYFSNTTTVTNFSVSVSASNSIIFSLPPISPGVAYLASANNLLTLPYLTCSTASTIAAQASLGTFFYSVITNATILVTVNVATVPKYSYYLNQNLATGSTITRNPAYPAFFALTYPTPNLIPFVECAMMQAVPIINYTTTGASVLVNEPEVAYEANTMRIVAYQATYFQTNTSGVPVSGGLGG